MAIISAYISGMAARCHPYNRHKALAQCLRLEAGGGGYQIGHRGSRIKDTRVRG